MSLYHIEEGILNLPASFTEDQSINILTFKELGTTLIVSRSQLKSGETFAASFNRQIKQLEKGMKNFLLKDKQRAEIGKDQKISGIECYNQFETDKQFISQYQFACETQAGMFVLSYSKQIELSKLAEIKQDNPEKLLVDLGEWEVIKNNYIMSETFKFPNHE